MANKAIRILRHCYCRDVQVYSRISKFSTKDTATTTLSTVVPFGTRSFSSSNDNGTRITMDATAGEDLYNRAQQVMEDVQQMEARREEEKSQAMYKAWERAQSKGYDSKSQAVKIVKTIAKETRKDINQEQQTMEELSKKREQAMEMLRQAADQHQHPEASVQLGNMMLQEAKKDFRSLQQQQNQSGEDDDNNQVEDDSLQQQQVVERHQAIEQKIHSSMRLFRQAGEGGSRVGWYNLGQIYWTGFPVADEDDEAVVEEDGIDDPTLPNNSSKLIVPPDNHEAMECFIQAIDLGDHDAMYLVGVHRLTQGGRENFHSGTNLIKRAAEAGHGGALYYLALLHLNGEPHLGLEPCTEEEFVEHLDRAVDAGSLDARFTRGHSYYHGTEGYTQNFKNSLDDFLLAADEGHADAAVSAGAMLHSGVGVLADQRRAFELYQLAGELGSEEGWMCVVDCWRNGLGVPKSEETAKHIEDTMLKKHK
mmetsp:Transcript_50153/g.121524  ORF Transcript_50153/g.121524 Transcript_50153/m.121524 type:complete len:479 (-) Transcript_50153:63-1499(-)